MDLALIDQFSFCLFLLHISIMSMSFSSNYSKFIHINDFKKKAMNFSYFRDIYKFYHELPRISSQNLFIFDGRYSLVSRYTLHHIICMKKIIKSSTLLNIYMYMCYMDE